MHINLAEDFIVFVAIGIFIAFVVFAYLNGKKNSEKNQNQDKEKKNNK
ncbi:MAG: hypothetical protein NT145_07220 [Elusimicrobia bacterium]|nr:hypothetical protein [Elusimicrobiota bacterium]